jgi:hypothetical protein
MSLFRYKEVCNYDFARHQPKNKRKVTGHFTQLVWKTSLKFGIGKAKSKNGCTYVVAHYKKPGNYEGEYRENVFEGNFIYRAFCDKGI